MTVAIDIFTDGSSRGNPGPGGFGVVMKWGNHLKEISAGFRKTTNNRMELLAVIVALQHLKKPGMQVTIHTDSKYVCEAVEKKWLLGWIKTNFKGKKNADLWKRYYELSKLHHIKFKWIKGHAGHVENERCDALATAAADNPASHQIDTGFESGLYN
jgi:ribonuclease HI